MAPTVKPYWKSDCGKYTLYHGDCLEILPTLEAGSVDACITDPPYGIPVGAAFVRGKKVFNGKGSFNEGASWAWLDDLSWLRDGGNIASFHRRGDTMPETVQQWHRFYIVKDAPPPTPRPCFVSAVEECSIARKHGKGRWFGGGYKPNYWRGLTPNRLGQSCRHPTEKPMEPIITLIECLSDVGELVADPYFGSGTTGVACVKTNRRFIGIEIEEKYCEIAAKRIEQEASHLFSTCKVEEGMVQSRYEQMEISNGTILGQSSVLNT